jgi:hypothetical protein
VLSQIKAPKSFQFKALPPGQCFSQQQVPTETQQQALTENKVSQRALSDDNATVDSDNIGQRVLPETGEAPHQSEAALAKFFANDLVRVMAGEEVSVAPVQFDDEFHSAFDPAPLTQELPYSADDLSDDASYGSAYFASRLL